MKLAQHQQGFDEKIILIKIPAKTHLDKTPTFKTMQKPTLTKHRPLKYVKTYLDKTPTFKILQ